MVFVVHYLTSEQTLLGIVIISSVADVNMLILLRKCFFRYCTWDVEIKTQLFCLERVLTLVDQQLDMW